MLEKLRCIKIQPFPVQPTPSRQMISCIGILPSERFLPSFPVLPFSFLSVSFSRSWADVLSGIASRIDYLDRCRWVQCLFAEDVLTSYSSFPTEVLPSQRRGLFSSLRRLFFLGVVSILLLSRAWRFT
ncbi:hypothetical protein BDW62DRAFT_52949 [Aspergillus aurantiobrunneus]